MVSETTTEPRNPRRKLVGKVSSDKMDKTITVIWQRTVRHKLYGKYLKRNTKVHAHDEKGEAKIGDLVELQATRPLSKTKTWRLVKVIRTAHKDSEE